MAWLMTGRYNTAAKTIELSEPIPGLAHGARVEIMVEAADHPEGPSFAAETLWARETLAPEAESGIREISWEKAKGHLLQFCFTSFWAPVQAEGLLDGNRFFFRARHGLWRFALSEDPETVEEPHKLTSGDADKPGVFYIESGPERDLTESLIWKAPSASSNSARACTWLGVQLPVSRCANSHKS